MNPFVCKPSSVPSRHRTLLVTLVASGALLLQAACGDDQSPRIATTVVANSSTTMTAVVGSGATPVPSVLVSDQDGGPIGGVPVTFVVTSGAGTITGGSASTNGSGVASLGSWTVGTTAGPNTLTATVGTLPPITFSATGTPGAPATLTKSAGDGQEGSLGAAVPIAPAVIIRDAHGNLVPNAMVTFSVASGGGSITSPQPLSTAAGVATVGSWTLGAAGANTLNATAAGTATVTFSATAISPCSIRIPHTFGTTSSGTLTTADCQFGGGEYVDYHAVTLPSAAAFLFTESSTAFDSFLLIYDAAGVVVASADDISPTNRNAAAKALLAPGVHLIGASTYLSNVTGAYTVASGITTSNVTNCEDVFIGRGVSTTQSLQTTDCFFNARYGDDYFISLRAGETVTISMTSTAVDAVVELWTTFGQRVAINNDRDASTTNAELVYTPTATAWFSLSATSNVAGQTGAYVLSVSAASGAERRAGGVQMQNPALVVPSLMRPKGSMIGRPRR